MLVQKIINTTPHDIVIMGEDNEALHIIPVSNLLIRINHSVIPCAEICGIPTAMIQKTRPTFIPEFSEGTYYVVSSVVKMEFPNREDFLVPFDFVRDLTGCIVGCRMLAR